MIINCSECGFPYDNSLRMCPECGNPTPSTASNHTGLTNCPNCGAPVTNSNRCEYCDSVFPKDGPDVVYVNNPVQVSAPSGSSDSAFSVGAAAFLGGVIGGILGD